MLEDRLRDHGHEDHVFGVHGAPLSEYRDIGDRHLMDRGATVYLRPDGPFTYGEFTSRSIQYDLRDPDED